MLVPSTIECCQRGLPHRRERPQTGRLSGDVDLHQPLLDSIVEDFRAGKRSKLILANRAIARFDKIGSVLESDDAVVSHRGLITPQAPI